jgi:hypothetical protein
VASSAVDGNAEQARELVKGIAAAKETLDSLAGAMAALGLDAKTGQAQAASDRAEELAGHANTLADALDSLRAQVEALRGLLTSAGGGGSASSSPSPLPSRSGGSKITRPSLPPDPDRKPGGPPAHVNKGSQAGNQGDIQSENDAAGVLARSGYEIVQNPPPKANGKEPDYFMEGDYWDCYTVSTDNPERVRKSIGKKANPKHGPVQASRIILNFDSRGPGQGTALTPETIEALLQRKPVSGLKEVKVIKNGRVRDLDLEG